jgi:hypothetical protein
MLRCRYIPENSDSIGDRLAPVVSHEILKIRSQPLVRHCAIGSDLLRSLVVALFQGRVSKKNVAPSAFFSFALGGVPGYLSLSAAWTVLFYSDSDPPVKALQIKTVAAASFTVT